MEFIKRSKEQLAADRKGGGKQEVHGIILGLGDNRTAECQLFDKKKNLVGKAYANVWIAREQYTKCDNNDLLTPVAGKVFKQIDGYWSCVPDPSVRIVNGVRVVNGVAVTAEPATRTKAQVQKEIDAAKAADDFDKAALLKKEFESLTV